MTLTRMRYAASLSLLLIAGGATAAKGEPQYGPNPDLPEPQRGLLPNMLKAVPSLSISYVVFENMKFMLI